MQKRGYPNALVLFTAAMLVIANLMQTADALPTGAPPEKVHNIARGNGNYDFAKQKQIGRASCRERV